MGQLRACPCATGPHVHGLRKTSHHVPREALVARTLRAGHPLTLLRAPVGSGKTTLLRQLATQTDGHGTWVTLTEPVTSRADAWRAIASTLEGCDSPVGSALNHYFASNDRSLDVRALIAAELIRWSEPYHIFIDQYDFASSEAFSQDLSFLLARTPNLRVHLAGTHLNLAPHLDDIPATLITAADLAFTEGETAEMAAKSGVTDRETVTQVHRATAGNAALITAILESSLPSRYLPQLVLGRVGADEALYQFALRLSVPDEFDEDLARLIATTGEPSRHIACLLDTGLLEEHVTCRGALYRYTPIVREILLGEALKVIPEMRKIREKVAHWYWERDEAASAFVQAVTSDAFELAEWIARECLSELLSVHEATSALLAASPRQVDVRPALALMSALAADARPDRRRLAVPRLQRAARTARAPHRAPTPARQVLEDTLASVACRLLGKPEEGADAARRAIGELDSQPWVELEGLASQHGHLRLHNVLTLARAGHVTEARHSLRPCLSDPTDDSPLAAAAAVTDAFISCLAGNMTDAHAALARAERSPTWLDESVFQTRTLFHLTSAVVRLEVYDLDGAFEHLDSVPYRAHDREFCALLEALRASLHLAVGNAELARHRLARFLYEHRSTQRMCTDDQHLTDALLAVAHVALGHLEYAELLLRELPAQPPFARLARAFVALLTGDVSEVVALASSVVRDAPEFHRDAAISHALLAAAALRTSNHSGAEKSLHAMATLMAQHGLGSPILVIPAADVALLRTFAASREISAAQRILHTELPGTLAPLEPVAPIRLTEREMVVLTALAHASTVADVADELVVSPNTVKSQLKGIYRKLGVSNRADALTVAFNRGLLTNARSRT